MSGGDAITRETGGAWDGHVRFAFDPVGPPVTVEPAPSGVTASIPSYAFDGAMPSATTNIQRGGSFVRLQHSVQVNPDEGRAVQFFDFLGGLDGNLNPLRIADELIDHRFATSNTPIDVRPITMAVARDCLAIDTAGDRVTGTVAPLTIDLSFFDARHGMTINQLRTDTLERQQSLPRRKADIEKLNLDRFRSGTQPDIYLVSGEDGLVQRYGGATSQGDVPTLEVLLQEVYRRPVDAGSPDSTVMGGIYVDRETYPSNARYTALFRYFLEPLGVSVDRWSMGVRGRSRTYTFADVFSSYLGTLRNELAASLTSDPVSGLTNPQDCGQLIAAVNSSLASLPPASQTPKYTDVQRIFNKSCIECHGGLDYPPYSVFGGGALDLSENEAPPPGADRLDRSHGLASGFVTSNPATSFLYSRITATSEDCPFGMMPCGGPALPSADIETIRRWIRGGSPNTRGDPHIGTVDGIRYDFQAAGEFVLLRGETLEIQARHTAVPTHRPLGPDAYTGLTSCVSINTGFAVRIGGRRITYQQSVGKEGALEVRVNGELVSVGDSPITVGANVRLVPTGVEGGLRIEGPGGTALVMTPGYWQHHQIWFLNLQAEHVRATEGLMGSIVSGSWLPSLPDGSRVSARPEGIAERYRDLYQRLGEAWRVGPDDSLFDYPEGLSSRDYQVRDWPLGPRPQTCVVGRVTGAGVTRGTVTEPMAADAASELCAGLTRADARADCVNDVQVTGAEVFAATYLQEERVLANTAPETPRLLRPEAFATDLTTPVNFTWEETADDEGEPLQYRHCVWENVDTFSLDACTELEGARQWPGGTVGSSGIPLLLLILVVLLLLLLALAWLFRHRRALAVLLVLLALLLLVLYVVVLLGVDRNPPTDRTVELNPGKTYYWKVIAEDGHGGTTESEMRRLEVAASTP